MMTHTPAHQQARIATTSIHESGNNNAASISATPFTRSLGQQKAQQEASGPAT
jgi:hypothetical protein